MNGGEPMRRVLLLLQLAMVFLMPGYAHGATQSAGIDLPMTIPAKFDTGTDHLLVPITINGSTFWCNLDTGFSALMVMDRSRVVKAGLVESSSRPTPDGNAPNRGDGSAVANVTMGSLTLRDQPIIVRDLPLDITDMECILGAGLFRQYLIEFDHVTPAVRLHERIRYTPPAGAVAVPLIFRTNPNVPFVQVGVELPDGTRQQLQTVLDTGTANYAMALVPPASTRVRERLPVASRPDRPSTGSGTVRIVAARPPAITVGPFRVESPVVALVEPGLGSVDDGTLGSGFLNRFTIGFDFIGRQMYLAPNQTFRTEQAFDASGVGFRRNGSKYEVHVVIPESPAARADLRVGDTLVTIDGTAAASLTLNQVQDRLSRPGAECELQLTREGKPLRVVLRLQRRL